MSMTDPFRNFGSEDMSADGGFRDSWKWSLPLGAGGSVVCLAIACYLAIFGAFDDHIDRRVDSLMEGAIALAGIFMAGARYDGHSRRRAMVSYETTRMQITAQRKSDIDDAAG